MKAYFLQNKKFGKAHGLIRRINFLARTDGREHWTEKHTKEWISIRQNVRNQGTLVDRLEDLQYQNVIDDRKFAFQRDIVL